MKTLRQLLPLLAATAAVAEQADLALLYPYSRELIRPLTVAGSALALAALSAAAWRSRR